MPRTFKQLLANEHILHTFVYGRVPNPVVIELFGLAGGFHGFWIDQEHAALTYDQICVAALAGRANGFDCFVRMAPVGYWQVTQNLEAGAGGVMAAQIHSAAQAEEFVRWAKFRPRGNRGINTGGRDAHYTHKTPAQFAADTNREQFVAIQIESVAAVADADAIAAIDGVDLLFVGPADLSLSLGIVGQFHDARLWDAIAAVAAACKNHGKHWGCVAPDPKFADRAVETGCRLVTTGSDVLALRKGIEAIKSAFASVAVDRNT
jgi:2-dehydro-3-deoxyglucarate aldolase/4-hydroxy-2-oxoheptanedioate aldolase